MEILSYSKESLRDAEIVKQLRELRHHCLIDNSNYAVAALAEFQLGNDNFAYVSGVNVENNEHNRLSTHAEQNAVTAGKTLLGPQAKFSKIWIMGAHKNVNAQNKIKGADDVSVPCGHCRQIIFSVAEPNAIVHSVTVNGVIHQPHKVRDLLQHAFTAEHVLPPPTLQTDNNQSTQSLIDLLKIHTELSEQEIFNYLQLLNPYIISHDFQTSSVTHCIYKINVNHSISYVPGVLVQDIAFLTTDAVFTAAGIAVTAFGGKNFTIQEVFLMCDALNTPILTSAEKQQIARFAQNENIPIHVYTPMGHNKMYHLTEPGA